MNRVLSGIGRRLRYGKPVIIVSGLPRSGTSMAMKMLEAGGLDLVVDDAREADEDNPKGYYEDERVMDLAEMPDKGWLRGARGRVIKVVSSLLNHLPPSNQYKIVFMRRNLYEVLASQQKMLARRGEESHTDDEEMLKMYQAHLEKVEFQIRFRSNLDAIYVHYPDVVANPATEARRIADFVGGDLDVDHMVSAVDRKLYRNRHTSQDGKPDSPGVAG